MKKKKRENEWVSENEHKISLNEIFSKNVNDFLMFQFREEFENLWKFENDFSILLLGKLSASVKFQKTSSFDLLFVNSILIVSMKH